MKEIAATPRGVRLVRQASEGDRGAHFILRQVRFPHADRRSPRSWRDRSQMPTRFARRSTRPGLAAAKLTA